MGSDGGTPAPFNPAKAAAKAPALDAEGLLAFGVSRLDLPRAVARLVVKRAQHRQLMLNRAAESGAAGARAGGGGGASGDEPAPAPSSSTPSADEAEAEAVTTIE